LESRFPGTFIPKYAMVTFHRIPYSIAMSRGRVQDRILEKLCHEISSVDDIDWKLAEQLVQKELAPIGDV
jgi:kynurenine 3-monooxygenase